MTEKKKNRASSRPLIPGGNNYTAMHLVFQEGSIRVKPSLWCYFFAGLLTLPVLFFVILEILVFKLFDDTDLIFLGIAAAVFAVSVFLVYIAVRMIYKIRKKCRSYFDLSSQVFYPDGYDREKKLAIPFSELGSLQVVEEYCSTGKSSFESYELNVVLCDGRRFNLLDHSNKECFTEEAEKLSGILSIPLTDAQGKCLSGDTFLALPSNVRENLLFGLCSFLLFAVLFAFGDGHSWYLTRQSFHWKQTQAWVEKAKIRKHSGRHITYSFDFQFRYHYQGEKFVGTHYDFFNMRTSEHTLKKIIQQYPPGKKFFCYVNPQSPKLAVVDRSIPPVWEMLLNSSWTSCLLIMGIFCILRALTQYRLLKKRVSKKFPSCSGKNSDSWNSGV